ncbi:DNA replication ATP-dependent helicase/nuclease Dna2 [Nematocida homosporus]|uniref:DNA replication ATP-dependent helicase/nuclease Dna2 n=1 Tax=Nematocida homosporus TaxID=1912981 RepID=UPI00221E58EE|nr:DNA replication ATP-dependent helicase/nuclease Dna2 [Nematocida homosporus]KAI5186156.1 DNA replication ATP-dependent helicase/nuclease Dna2 [Nematocida homosporus]
MALGWESPKRSSVKRVKIEMDESLAELNFWDTVSTPRSPLTSEISLDLDKQGLSVSFKVVSIERLDNWARIWGTDNEVVEISGIWLESLPRIGNGVTIMRCLCCPTKEGDLSVVNNEENYLIIHGKKSLSTTHVIQSVECVRKALLTSQVEVYNQKWYKQQVHGLILHEWFEYLLAQREAPLKEVAKELKSILCRRVLEIYRIDEKIGETFKQVFKHLGALKKFITALRYTTCTNNRTRHSRLLQIKGKSDATILDNGLETEIELKTGAQLHNDNIAQVILYGLLQKEALGYLSQTLYHMKSGSTQSVALKHPEVRSLLNQRNKIVQTKQLPPRQVINHCRVCYAKEMCTTIAEIEEASSGLGNLFDHSLSQPLGLHNGLEMLKSLDFDDPRLFGYLWEQIQAEEDSAKETLFQCAVSVWEGSYLKLTILANDKSCHLYNDDFVVLYDETKCAVGKGVISAAGKEGLEVHMFEDLSLSFESHLYISKDPSVKYFAELRGSLIQLYTSSKVRKAWKAVPQAGKFEIHGDYVNEFFALNFDQQKALASALSSTPYTLIHGMPGTGKTKVISLLIRILVATGKKVLVCCYTRLSLCNIAARLENQPHIKMYRTGVTKIEKLVDRPEEIGAALDTYNVVLATTRSVFKDVIFDKSRRFDVYIADEATQQNMLLSVIPALVSNAMVLVGDHLQLHPLANAPGLRLSLFEILRERSPVASLTYQYRMPKCIMDVANDLFYAQQMKCKSKEMHGSIGVIDITDDTQAETILAEAPSSAQILCYFNDQVRTIRALGKSAETIDRFQGSEAEDIILIVDLFVPNGPSNEILLSPQRLNVALTRAKKSLLILGRTQRLAEHKVFADLFQSINKIPAATPPRPN